MTLPQPVHPLTPDEIELYTRCARTWCDGGMVWDSVKTDVLSDELKQRLIRLAEIAGVEIDFILETGQYFIRANRERKQQ